MRMLDLFCGRFGWGKAFAARGWEVVGVDLVEPDFLPPMCQFERRDVLEMSWPFGDFDFVCASSPCENFSLWNMRMFHPNPPYPELGIKLFNHTRAMLEQSGIPYVMENVRGAEKFVGKAVARCGPFYLWGNAVPPLMPQGISKGISMGWSEKIRTMTIEEKRAHRKQFPFISTSHGSKARQAQTAAAATIPPELSACVADYAERLIEQRRIA